MSTQPAQDAVSATQPRFRVEQRDAAPTLVLNGDWRSASLGKMPTALSAALPPDGVLQIDVSGAGRIDTAGAFAIVRAAGAGREMRLIGADSAQFAQLRSLMERGMERAPRPDPRPGSIVQAFDRLGRGVVGAAGEGYRSLGFAGRLVIALLGVLRHPSRLRLTPLVSVMEQSGVAAIPIVVVMTFFIGAVLALVGSSMLQTLGVTIYAVELVGIGVLREFGAVVAAILFSGRSASAFAAQLGSMRMNQEIDAMQVMGVDTFEALIVPRVLAVLIMLPLLTVVADVGGLLGGMLVSAGLLQIAPELFFQRLVDSVGSQQFWVGMAKTPLFALVIAGTGCRQGLAVGSDVESLGIRVTSAVVQSIFLIIMFDALFAILFWRLDL